MQPIGEARPRLGDKVTFSPSRYNGTTAIVIAIDHNDKSQPYLVGWPTESPSGYVTTSINNPRLLANCDVIKDYPAAYQGCAWIHAETEIIAISRKIQGMKCSGKHCTEPFNAYAEPNQDNGSFLCYSCRQRPSYER